MTLFFIKIGFFVVNNRLQYNYFNHKQNLIMTTVLRDTKTERHRNKEAEKTENPERI
jgi:hypothetical protein